MRSCRSSPSRAIRKKSNADTINVDVPVHIIITVPAYPWS